MTLNSIISWLFSSDEWLWFGKNIQCDKDPTKQCSHKTGLTVTENGTIRCSASDYVGCCKGQKLLKQMENMK